MKLVGLKEIRKKKKCSQLKLSIDLSLSREAISAYETGRNEPPLQLLIELSNYFNVSIDYIITGKEFNSKK